MGLLVYAKSVGQPSDRRHMSEVNQSNKKKVIGPPKTLSLSTQERIELLSNVILDKILAEMKPASSEKG